MTAIIFYCLLSPAVTNMPKDKTPSEAFVAIVQGKRSSRLAEKEQASPSKTTTNKSAGTNSQQSSPAKQSAETPSDDALVVPTAENMSAKENVSPPPKSNSTLKGLFF